MFSLVLVEKLILNSLHLPSFSWKLLFEAFLSNTSTALCIELDWFFATNSQIVVSSTYFHISMSRILRSYGRTRGTVPVIIYTIWFTCLKCQSKSS